MLHFNLQCTATVTTQIFITPKPSILYICLYLCCLVLMGNSPKGMATEKVSPTLPVQALLPSTFHPSLAHSSMLLIYFTGSLSLTPHLSVLLSYILFAKSFSLIFITYPVLFQCTTHHSFSYSTVHSWGYSTHTKPPICALINFCIPH